MATLLDNVNTSETLLAEIASADARLTSHFRRVLGVAPELNRQLVSFQANKATPGYRWYKYKEAFSSRLVKHLLRTYHVPAGTVLDPFAGVGTTLFAASEQGYGAEGIELLPIGIQIIQARLCATRRMTQDDHSKLISWRDELPWEQSRPDKPLNHLRITRDAYAEQTETEIRMYLSALKRESEALQCVLLLALLSVLESVSYTRKDGQYLRWDHRSGRRKGRNHFNKGHIVPFSEAITHKLSEIIDDLNGHGRQISLFPPESTETGDVALREGSCLDILPTIPADTYCAIITSPPYCNRYDYTRTYALELAVLGVSEQELLELRQNMLSCTVENKEKDLLEANPAWDDALRFCESNHLLQSILSFLEYKKQQKELNNNGIPRMVKGYFYEMACVLHECYRTLKQDGLLFMVNDNVRYAAALVSVDLILSEIAEDIGFSVERIMVLPNGKGNSSQQMGAHGRESLRKCVYVWRKPRV